MHFLQRSWKYIAVLVAMLGMSGLNVVMGGNPAYKQNTFATMDDMESKTVATWPANQARTTIGIGEEIICTIDDASWSDTDCNYITGQVEEDTIGACAWAKTGAGELAVISMYEAKLTAHHSPGTVEVKATITDSKDRYDDPDVIKTLNFTVVAPSGESATVFVNCIATYGPKLGPPNKRTGSKTIFAVTVQPTTVCFKNAVLQETADEGRYTWPNGTPTTFPAFELPLRVIEENSFLDTFSISPVSIKRLLQNGAYVDFSIDETISREYKNQDGVWVQYTTLPTKTEYRGADIKSRQVFNATTAGGWLGPWQ